MAHICALTALVSVLWASPVQVFERDEGVCPANSGFTAGDWCSGNLGNNVVMQVSDQKSDWGTVNPGDVVQSIRDRCLTGACNEFSWEFDSMCKTQFCSSKRELWRRLTHSPIDANPQRVEVTPGKVKVTLVDTILDKIHTGPMLDALQYTLDHLKDFRVDKIDPSYKCSAGICDNGHGTLPCPSPPWLTVPCALPTPRTNCLPM